MIALLPTCLNYNVWLELNEESARVDNSRLPRKLLIMRFLSTLPDDYLKFRTTRSQFIATRRHLSVC